MVPLLCVFGASLLIAGQGAAAPDYSGSDDYSKELDLGYNSASALVRAPFNVTRDFTGLTELHYIQVTSTNGVPVTIKVYDSRTFNEVDDSRNAGDELIHAWNVTSFLWDIASYTVETLPAQNHTENASVRSGFSNVSLSAPDGAFYVILERRAPEAAHVLYQQDRGTKLGIGSPAVFGTFVFVGAGAAVAVLAVVFLLLKARKPPAKGAPPPDAPR